MTKFIDGPLAGNVLALKQCPRFLRAVKNFIGTVDALDAPDDKPAPDEKIFAYVLHKHLGSCHINRGRKGSGFFQISEYTFVERQPDDLTMRNTSLWNTWVQTQPPPDLTSYQT